MIDFTGRGSPGEWPGLRSRWLFPGGPIFCAGIIRCAGARAAADSGERGKNLRRNCEFEAEFAFSNFCPILIKISAQQTGCSLSGTGLGL